jgi:acyl-CoA thioester hydrolase
MDRFGHLNNAALAQIYDDALARFDSEVFGLGALLSPGERQLLVAESSARYLTAAHWPDEIVVGVGATRVGTSSFALGFGLFQGGTCLGTSDTVMVHAEGGAASPLPPGPRARLTALLLAPCD